MLRTWIAAWALSGAAAAQISLFDWTLEGDPSGSGSQTATELHVVGPDGGSCPWSITYFQTVAPVGGLVTVDVDFQNLDSWAPIGHPVFDAPFAYVAGEILKAPTAGAQPSSGWPTGSYVLQFSVKAADVFGLGVWSSDCSEGPGIAEFKNFVFTPQPFSSYPLQIDPRVRLDVQPLSAVTTFPVALGAVEDTQGDGVPDLVIGSGNAAWIVAGADGAVLQSLTGPSSFGEAVAGAGDVDGDGFGDVIVGAPTDSHAGGTFAGSAHVHSGHDGATIFTLMGSTDLARLGSVVAGVGDLDGDGFDDVAARVVGVSGASPEVRLAAGPSGAPLATLTPPVADSSFGRSIAPAGDVDGDGTLDVIVGGSSQAWVFSGRTYAVIHPLGSALGGELSVAGAGDADADGFDDLVLGAPSFGAGFLSPGRAQVFSGATGTAVLTLDGAESGDRFGWRVAGGGDFDGDGRLDIAVSAPKAAGARGRVSVHDAFDGGLRAVIEGTLPGEELGEELCRLGDVDGDGRDDLAVGLPGHGPDDTGLTRVYQRLDHPGPPALAASGSLQPGGLLVLELTQALPAQPVFLVAGTSYVALPLLGGVLGPAPRVVVPLTTGGSGDLTLHVPWPTGLPTGWTVWMQYWTVDAAAPQGVAASNAIAASQL